MVRNVFLGAVLVLVLSVVWLGEWQKREPVQEVVATESVVEAQPVAPETMEATEAREPVQAAEQETEETVPTLDVVETQVSLEDTTPAKDEPGDVLPTEFDVTSGESVTPGETEMTEASETAETEAPSTEEPSTEAADVLPSRVVLDVTPVLQNPELPTGCESVALTMALQFLGFDLEKTTIARDYLVRSSSNYGAGYVGNPFSDRGAGVFAPGLTLTANAFLEEQETDLVAHDVSGADFETLYTYIANGYPVVLWTTMYFGEPTFSGGSCKYEGRTFRWYNNEHCVLLGGFDQERGLVTIFDPLQGMVAVKEKTVRSIYEKTGMNAVVICNESAEPRG